MRRQIVLWLIIILLLAACREDGDSESTVTPDVTATAATATAEATATPQPTATATATPLPPEPEVSAVQQEVGDDGEVIISSVYAPEAAWLVLYADDDGEPGEMLGHVAVEEGESRDVSFVVDPYQVTETLHVALHEDLDEVGTFESPEVDRPLEVDGEPVRTSFDVDISVTMPQITVSDQALGTDGQLVIDSVVARDPGWLVLQVDENGEPGAVLGQTPVSQGENSNVVVNFNWRNATRQLYAALYRDAGRPGRFDLGGDDVPVEVDGEPVRAAFNVSLPADVTVINQPVTTGEIVIDRILIDTAGWVAIYSNYEGFIDRLLGYTALEPGVHRNVRVSIDPRNSTDLLHIMLHQDTATEGEFEYPAEDPPLRDDEGNSLLFTFQTREGNYVITRDQALGEEDTVVVPLVVTDLSTWVVVWNDAEGAPGDIIGQELVGPGVHREVSVSIDAEEATDVLHVMLHQDAGTPEEFEYPDGPDGILQSQGAFISAPFTLLSDGS